MRKFWQFFQIIYMSTIISANSENRSFDEEIYELTNGIYSKYFQAYRCVTYAADDVSNAVYLEMRLPRFVINLTEGGGPTSKADVIRESIEQGCSGVIVQTKMENRLKIALSFKIAKTQVVGNRYNVERYLFLPVSVNDTNAEFLLDNCMYFLPNLLFVSPEETSGKYLIQTHEYFDPERSDRVEVLDEWTSSRGFERGADLYPDKIKNLNGKTLTFAAMPYIPYSVVIEEANRTIFDGIEARLAWEFLNTINGSFAGVNFPVELWGYIFPNGSGTGVLGSVYQHKADAGYSAIYQWDCDIMDCTYPFILAEIYCLVPKPRILTSWMTLLLPFRTMTWIGLSVAFILNFCFLFVLGLILRRLCGVEISGQHVSSVFQSAYTIFRLQMLQVPAATLLNNPIAIYLRVALLFYFFVSIFWQGGIASILTVPRYEKPIDTPEELVASWPQIEWGAVHDAWVLSIIASKDPVLVEIVKKYRTLDNDTVLRRSKKRDFALFLEKLPNNHFGFNDYVNEESVPPLRLMKQYIYTSFVVMILPKGSPFTQKFDHVIHWLVATGVLQKMENQISLERINNHLQLMIQHSNDRNQNSRAILSVGHIQGALYIYFGGIFISFAVFILEKYLGRKKSKKVIRRRTKIMF